MEFKKNIVLTSPENNAQQKALLSYYKQNKTYHFDFKGINFLPKDRILGLYIKDNIYKYDLQEKNLSFELDLQDNIDNISVVVLDKQNMLKPFLWGTQLITDGDYLLNKVIEEVNIKSIQEENAKIENNTFKIESIITENEKQTLENFSFVDNLNKEENKLENLEKEEFNEETQEDIDEIINLYQEEIDSINEEKEFNTNNFYSMIATQVEKMLNENQTEEILEDIIPDSRFVEIPKHNGESYIFGIIYENDKPKYLCYGEKGKFSEERPDHLKAYYQWLPIDVDNLSGDGYYMMYQDANTGKNLEMTVI